MLLSLKILIIALVTNADLRKAKPERKNEILPPLLPDTYKDIFVAGGNGKPTLGTPSATCWARGGVCMHIRYCRPGMKIDSSVAGCAWGFKVCCKMIQFGSPTVGVNRRDGKLLINDVDGRRFWDIATRNSKNLVGL